MTTRHEPEGSHDHAGSSGHAGELAARFTRAVVAAAPPPLQPDRLVDRRPRRSPRRYAALVASVGLVAATVVALAVLPLDRGGERAADRPAGTGERPAGAPPADVWSAGDALSDDDLPAGSAAIVVPTVESPAGPPTSAGAVAIAGSVESGTSCVDESELPACPALPTRESIARFSLRVAHGYTTEQRVVIRRAWDGIYLACVAAAEPASIVRNDDGGPVVIAEPDWQYEADQLNFDDFELIGRTGYHWQFQHPSQIRQPPPGAVYLAEYSVTPSNAVEAACKHAANDAFGGVPPGSADERLTDADNAVRSAALAASERLRQAGERWARCMESHGYSGREFTDAHRVLRFVEDPEPTEAEIAEALADAECRAASGYTATRNDLIETGVRQWQAGNAEVIGAVAVAIEREVARAEQLLAGTGSTS